MFVERVKERGEKCRILIMFIISFLWYTKFRYKNYSLNKSLKMLYHIARVK